MKTFRKIIAVFYILIVSSCENVPDFDPGESEPVVEAFIYEGESVDDIYLKKTVPFNTDSTIEPELISDAIITISSDGQDFMLSSVTDQPGRYFYDGIDLSVNIGDNYQLTFEYEDRIISSTTTIPYKPTGVEISQETIEIPQINSIQELRDFIETFQETIDITWSNNDANYYYLVIENVEDNPESIDPSDVLGDLGINFEFTTTPTQLDFLALRPMIHYTQYGMHKVTIYSVNEEYALLYESSEQDSRDLNEPFTNINNGIGIFTGFASEVVYFNAIQQ